jgi:uncharacterized protein (TIGR03437 family)
VVNIILGERLMNRRIVTIILSICLICFSPFLAKAAAQAGPQINSAQFDPIAVGGTQCVNGTGFGTSQGSITINGLTGQGSITINGLTGTVLAWTDTQVCASLQGVGVGTASVQISNVVGSSNTLGFGVVSVPVVDNFVPRSTGSGLPVTITGSGFGAQSGGVFLSVFGPQFPMGIVSWTDTQIVATVPTGTSVGTYHMYVSTRGLDVFTGSNFNIISPPTITSLQLETVAIRGTQCVTGTGFGPNLGTVTVNGIDSDSISAWSDTQVCATLPFGVAAGTANLHVSNGAGASNSLSFTVVPVPTVGNFIPRSAGLGSPVTIVGSGFGTQSGGVFLSVFGPQSPMGIVSWSDTQIVATVPTGISPGTYQMYVSTQGLNVYVGSNFNAVANAPVISALAPTSGLIGSHVIISGSGFGAQGSGIVQVGALAANIINWSDTSIEFTVPTGAINGDVTVVADGSIGSNGLPFSISSGGPLLQVSTSDTPLQVNLTSPQVLDWIHWGRISATVPDRKDSAMPLISDITAFNGAQAFNSSGNIAFSWADGNHPAAVSEATEDIETFSTAGGFQITVPADTTVKTLNLYAEVFFGQGVLHASLSDGSVADINDQSVIDSDIGNKVYSIDFRAASAGQTLTVIFTGTASSSGVGLQAATLTPHLPVVAITSPSGGQSFASPAMVPATASASQFDNQLTDVKILRMGGTVLDGSASPFTGALGPLTGGHYSVTASATDSASLTNNSSSVEFDVIQQGGSLTVQKNDAAPTSFSSPIDLNAQGTSDWVLWGPFDNGDEIIDNPNFVLARKTGVAPLISNYRALGNHRIEGFVFSNDLFFADGAQVFFGGSNLLVHGLASGYEVTVPADSTPRTLQLYVGAISARGKLSVFLSDGSAPVITDSSFDIPSPADANGFGSTAVYAITYQAASAGQILTIRYTLDFDYGHGEVDLVGATLSGIPITPVVPAPQITSIDPNKAPVNTQVTITGANFGVTQDNSTVNFGGVAAQIVNWSDTGITVWVPTLLSDGSNAQVLVTTTNGTSNAVTFNVPSINFFPQKLSLLVGQSGSVTVKDLRGNVVSGLSWSTSDPNIVSLSTDDPPIISGLAIGSATVYAGDVPLQVTIYAGTALPPGLPLWSIPVNTGATSITSIIPAMPNNRGVDLLVGDDSNYVSAYSGEGELKWRQPIVPNLEKIIPDFSGNTLVSTVPLVINSDGTWHQHHRIDTVDPDTGNQVHFYTYSEKPKGPCEVFLNGQPGYATQCFDDVGLTQAAIPSPSGTLFIQDHARVAAVNMTTQQPLVTLDLDQSTSQFTKDGVVTSLSVDPLVSKMIVAGDGNAYLSYSFFNLTANVVSPPDPNDPNSHGSCQTHTITKLMTVSVSPDGAVNKFPLKQTSNDSVNCMLAPTQQDFAPPPSLQATVVTNADQGAAVFSSDVCSQQSCTILSLIGQGSLVAQTNFPSESRFVPVLQRADGSYIGTDNGSLRALDLGGDPLWQQKIQDQNGVTIPLNPLYATAGGGIIANSPQLGLVMYDQNGIQTGNAPDTGARVAWNGKWYGDNSVGGPSFASYALDAMTFEPSFLPQAHANPSQVDAANRFTKEIAVIGWINPLNVELPDPAQVNPNLPLELGSTLGCPLLLKSLSNGDRSSISSDADRRFVNAFLISQSANAEPPSQLDPSILREGYFRAYTRTQAVIEPIGNEVLQAQFYNTISVLGDTPDACHSAFTTLANYVAFGGKLLKAETYPDNNKSGVAVGRLHAFHLAEGRVGPEAQAANRTLNACANRAAGTGFCTDPAPPTTPWIWAITKFDSQGQYTVDNQIFPTYYIYENGTLVKKIAQQPVESFIGLNAATSEVKVSDIR